MRSQQRFGCYDVTALLGEGGMGQVWQATDTQLGRQVALKILPDAFAADPDRLARFEREAHVTRHCRRRLSRQPSELRLGAGERWECSAVRRNS